MMYERTALDGTVTVHPSWQAASWAADAMEIYQPENDIRWVRDPQDRYWRVVR